MDTYYIDGKFVDDADAKISVKDIIVLRAFGIFDYLITYNKRPFYLHEHVDRFENSAKNIGLKLNNTHDQICDIVVETIKRNPHHNESAIRIVHSGGISSDSVTPEGNGIFMVIAVPSIPFPATCYKDGASIVTVEMERFMPDTKSTSYLCAVLAQQKAKECGAIEAVYVDRSNRVLEGTTSNIFCFRENTLITPPDAILCGITRDVVLKLAKEHYPIEIRHIDMYQLMHMDEIFLTSSNKEVMPVVKVNGSAVGTGNRQEAGICKGPGSQTRHVMQLFKEYTVNYGKGSVA
ncbi:MAG: aminotransferase class IV [Desulfamplus sp.]|nr:aminotransferase class IV [Desulfamplus sp.]